MWLKTPEAPRAVTHGVFRSLEDPDASSASTATHYEILRLREQYRFFHWHLEFPEVFSVPEGDEAGRVDEATGWTGGFDCVLGNPPWDSVELKEQEFFAQRAPEIAAISNASARKKQIAKLQDAPDTLELYAEYAAAKRAVYAESHFLRRSQRVPLTGQGNLNLYAVFAETDRILTGEWGRVGVIVPTGIATDARTQYFFKDLVLKGSIAALYDFENRAGLFPAVDSRMKFSILSLTGRALREPAARFAFFLHDTAELDEADKAFNLTPEEITLLNPNTGTCPVFRSRRDAEITLGIYRRVPVLIKEGDPSGNPWGVSFLRMFDMSHDSHLFHTREDLEAEGWHLEGNIFATEEARMLPLYEAKMVDFYNHRAADVVKSETAAQRQNQPEYLNEGAWRDRRRSVIPNNWVAEREVRDKLESRGWHQKWHLGWRDVTSSTNERTVIVSIIPDSAAANSLPVSIVNARLTSRVAELLACLSSYVLDYAARLKVGGVHLNFFICNQFPVLAPEDLAQQTEFIRQRVVELAYAASDLEPFARDLGDTGAPFIWNEDRRTVMRAELDALFFHLYGINRDDVDYILDTFPIVKRKDEAKYGTYRTKDLILAEYDRMAAAGVSLTTPLVDGENYTSTLTPPPGHGPRHPAA
jgi:hypothetical protein